MSGEGVLREREQQSPRPRGGTAWWTQRMEAMWLEHIGRREGMGEGRAGREERE